MKDIFHYCQNKSHKKHNLHVHKTWKQQTSCSRCWHLEFLVRKCIICRFNLRTSLRSCFITYTCKKLYKHNFVVLLCVDILAGCTKKRVMWGLSGLIRFLATVYIFYFVFLFNLNLILQFYFVNYWF